ncbi:putative transposase [Arthrospira platensis C1]|nr:putative transposase [Arthrospira platensis C1]
MPFTLSTTLFARPQQDREMLVVAEARIRHCIEQFDSLHDAMDSVLKAAS